MDIPPSRVDVWMGHSSDFLICFVFLLKPPWPLTGLFFHSSEPILAQFTQLAKLAKLVQLAQFTQFDSYV